MSVAVLVNGECRELPIAVKSWRFLKELDCDVFVSTWNKCIQINRRLGINIQEDITEDHIKTYLPNAIISINDKNNYDFSSDVQYHNAKQIFHWKNSLRMMKSVGKKYDLVIITRPDNYKFYQFHSERLLSMNNPLTIYGQLAIHASGPGQFFVPEYFFCGSEEVITKMIETLPNEMPGNIHHDLAVHIMSLGMYVHPMHEFDLTLARPTLRGLENLDRDLIQKKFWEWGQNTENNK